MSDPVLFVIAAGAGLTVTLVMMAAAVVVTGTGARVRTRVSAYTESSPYVADVDVLRDRRASRFPLLDTWLKRQSWSEATRVELERAGYRLRVGEYLILRMMTAVLGVSGAVLLAARLAPAVTPLAMIVGGFAGFIIPAYMINRRVRSRSAQMELQLVEMCELMASMLSSGFGYMQALMATAEQLDPPLSDELRRMVEAVQIGGDADEALEEMTERMSSADFKMAATAIMIHRSTGGDLAEIMRGVASTIRDRQSFKREVAALTSRERASAVVMAGFPMVIAAGLIFMAPDVFGVLLTETVGRIMMGVAIALDLFGYFVIKRVSTINV